MSNTLSMPALDELNGKIEAKQKLLGTIFDEANDGSGGIDLSRVKSISGDTFAKAEDIRKLNDELADLSKQADELKAVKRAAEGVRTAGATPPEQAAAGGVKGAEPGAPASFGERPTKSFGQMFVESKAYKGRTGGVGPEARIDVELKAVFSTTAGWAPETTRTGRLVDFATRPVQVTDIIPSTTTSQAAVVYMEETTFTNAAAEAAEAGPYAEAALALTEQSSTVRKIAVFLPVTDEQLEDEPQVRGYIDNRLPFMVRQRLDGQILVGNGTAPNLRGVNNVVGIQTQAKGTDPTPDAVYKAIVKVRVTGRAMPNAVIMHPNDWQDIRLLRTADGIYIWGNPSDTGPERIWGLAVAQSDAQTENTAVVGDFANYSELAVRRGVDVQVSNSHADFFVNGKQALRADMRAALLWYRPAAFCTVTGI
jgi:HK97 family phage major capsid protein